jgi:hypothetical protein
MPDKTKIVFSGGAELEVGEEPSQVTDRLIKREPFTRFKTSRGTDVYVIPDQIAYVEQIPAPRLPSAPTSPSRNRIG